MSTCVSEKDTGRAKEEEEETNKCLDGLSTLQLFRRCAAVAINKVIFHAKSILLPLQFHSQQAAQFIQQTRSLGPERGRERWEDKEVKGEEGMAVNVIPPPSI